MSGAAFGSGLTHTRDMMRFSRFNFCLQFLIILNPLKAPGGKAGGAV